MSERINIQIIEYKDGVPMHLYYGVNECAEAFHCHTELIKALIFTGNPFPYLDDNITFDIAPSCHCHIVRGSSRAKCTRYYSFDIVPDDNDSTGTPGNKRSLT